MLRHLDLFSGIGGFALAARMVGGYETVGFCEINKRCHRVLRREWPSIPIYDDVRKLNDIVLHDDWPFCADQPIDIITGGFPCQDISWAGEGAGIDGERSGLWTQYARLVGELRPRFVLVENVSALLGRGLERVLGDLATLGYDALWHCIPACAIGANHERDRIWIVAYPEGEPRIYESIQKVIATRLSDDAPTWWANHPWDEAESKVCRVDDGIPDRVDRTECLGNAIVWQVAAIFLQAIKESATGSSQDTPSR